jgi:hypothetical protein
LRSVSASVKRVKPEHVRVLQEPCLSFNFNTDDKGLPRHVFTRNSEGSTYLSNPRGEEAGQSNDVRCEQSFVIELMVSVGRSLHADKCPLLCKINISSCLEWASEGQHVKRMEVCTPIWSAHIFKCVLCDFHTSLTLVSIHYNQNTAVGNIIPLLQR